MSGIFKLGDWIVNPDTGEIQRGDEVRRLQPLPMAVLCRLADAGGRLVTREELMRDVWHGRAMSDEPINRCIAELRASLDDNRSNPRFIRTVPKRGYELVETAHYEQEKHSRSALTAYALLFVVFVAAMIILLLPDETETAQQPRLLVVPLDALGDATEMLSGALTEELLNALAQSPDMLVYSRTTTFALKETGTSPMVLARQLGADYVLEGALRLDENTARITAQLIDANTEIHVFSRELEYPRDRIEALIIDISQSIVARIAEALPVKPPLGVLRQLDFSAYRDFIEAKHIELSRQGAKIPLAIQRLKSVVEKYPDFAEGHALLAWLYYRDRPSVHAFDPESYPLMKLHLAHALELDPENPLAIALDTIGKPRATVIREFQRVLALDPQMSNVRFGLARSLFRAGYLQRAKEELSWLQLRNPLDAPSLQMLALSQLALGNPDFARESMAHLVAINEPGNFWLGFLLAIQQGDYEAVVTYWPSLRRYDAAEMQVSAEQIAVLLDPVATEGGGCQLQLMPEKAAVAAKLNEFWHFLFLATTPGCESVAAAARFKNAHSLPASDIPFLIWFPMMAEFRRHPGFVEFATQFDLPEVWGELGPPDLCAVHDTRWQCR